MVSGVADHSEVDVPDPPRFSETDGPEVDADTVSPGKDDISEDIEGMSTTSQVVQSSRSTAPDESEIT